MVLVIARFRPRTDRLDALMTLLDEVQTASRADDGCLNYGYYRNITDEESYVAVEEWRDMAALESHLRTPHVARLIAALQDHAAEPPQIAAHVIEHSTRLPLPG